MCVYNYYPSLHTRKQPREVEEDGTDDMSEPELWCLGQVVLPSTAPSPYLYASLALQNLGFPKMLVPSPAWSGRGLMTALKEQLF